MNRLRMLAFGLCEHIYRGANGAGGGAGSGGGAGNGAIESIAASRGFEAPASASPQESPAVELDYDRLAQALLRQGRTASQESTPRSPASSRPPSLNEIISGSAQPPAPQAGGSPPRRVDRLEQNGLVDVFSLSADQIQEMGADKVVEHYERTLAVARRHSGAPQLPRALRNARGGKG